jgi:hypothetical protein
MSSPLDQFTFILDADHKPVQHANDDAWWEWYRHEPNRRVAKTEIGDVTVSTVFVSLLLRPPPNNLPFETKIFGGPHDREEWLTATWKEAEAQHEHIVAMLRRAQHIEQSKTEAQAATTDNALKCKIELAALEANATGKIVIIDTPNGKIEIG